MRKMKILSVVGARPQFIKAAVVSKALKESGIEEYLVHTGQHFDSAMSQVFFDELKIPAPDINLEIAEKSHAVQTARMLEKLEEQMLAVSPDFVLVYGDTNSTLAAALAAVKIHIPIAHVEAGLRSFNKRMPEEINRITTDHCSDILFSTSPVATQNLKNESIHASKIAEVGDVMFDGVIYYSRLVGDRKSYLAQLNLRPKSYVLCTIHRAENTDDKERLRRIFDSLVEINKNAKVVLPLHPRTRNKLSEHGWLEKYSKVMAFIEPVGYLDMLALERNAKLIITDSGGIQKEAYYLDVPCVTYRDETEWVELVDQGFNTLVSPALETKTMIEKVMRIMNSEIRIESHKSLYGGGNAVKKIVETLLRNAK